MPRDKLLPFRYPKNPIPLALRNFFLPRSCGGGESQFPKGWKKAREEALRRSGYKCQSCGISVDLTSLQVDHIIPRALGGDNSVLNLRVLCIPCHKRLEVSKSPGH